MKRLCPYCHIEMSENCYLKDRATPLNDYVVIEKDENYKKIERPIKVALCQTCGHIELYVDIDEKND